MPLKTKNGTVIGGRKAAPGTRSPVHILARPCYARTRGGPGGSWVYHQKRTTVGAERRSPGGTGAPTWASVTARGAVAVALPVELSGKAPVRGDLLCRKPRYVRILPAGA